ncbi:MAG: hypothetical protein ABIC68_01150 [Candidatus Omnitrophota bacterium]
MKVKKTGKVLLAALAVSVFHMVFGALTCGWLFSWVYTIEPVNIWRHMDGPPGPGFMLGTFLFNIIFVIVYVVLKKGVPGKTKLIKGLVFGLCVWAVGILPGMFVTAYFMTVAPVVVVYWILIGLIETPLKGLIAALVYGEK